MKHIIISLALAIAASSTFAQEHAKRAHERKKECEKRKAEGKESCEQEQEKKCSKNEYKWDEKKGEAILFKNGKADNTFTGQISDCKDIRKVKGYEEARKHREKQGK